MRRRLLLACCLLGILVSSPAKGASWDARERAALKACLSGNTDKGISLLSDLFVDSLDPTYLYNQGRCYEQNHRWEDAISRFREYLRKATRLKNADRTETLKHIAECQSYLERPKTEQPLAPEPPRVVGTPTADRAPSPSVVVEQPAPSLLPSQATGASESGSALRTAGLVASSVGTALLVSGIVLNLKVNSMSRDLEQNWAPSTNSSREEYKTLGWASYGVGSACLAGGAILFYLGWSKGRQGVNSFSLSPSVASGQVAVTVRGPF